MFLGRLKQLFIMSRSNLQVVATLHPVAGTERLVVQVVMEEAMVSLVKETPYMSQTILAAGKQ